MGWGLPINPLADGGLQRRRQSTNNRWDPVVDPLKAKLVGLIALGHSGLTGEDSDPSHPGVEAKQNSWATGTTAGLLSIYQRMMAIWPDTGGEVANVAVGGARDRCGPRETGA